MDGVWGLTFELSRHQRWDARARVAKMYRVPPAGPAGHAVGARFEQGVRPHPAESDLIHDWPQGCHFQAAEASCSWSSQGADYPTALYAAQRRRDHAGAVVPRTD